MQSKQQRLDKRPSFVFLSAIDVSKDGIYEKEMKLFELKNDLPFKQLIFKGLALAGGFEAHPFDEKTTRMRMKEIRQDETRAQHTNCVSILQIKTSKYILREY